jgi:hypothetical protein
VQLERSDPDRLAAEGGKQQQACWRGEFRIVCRDAPGRVEPGIEPFRQFGEIRRHG